MAAKIRTLLRDKRGSAAVEFIFTAAMLILVFTVLVTAVVYITQYYNASYICRRVVRTIEICGEYNESEISTLANGLGGSAMDDMRITIDVHYVSERKIQLCDVFTVHFSANYPINIMMFGDEPIQLNLPIALKMSGRSEVFWK